MVPQSASTGTYYMETTLVGIDVYAQGISIRYRKEDFKATPTPMETREILYETPSPSEPEISGKSPTGTALNGQSSGGLPTAAYAGIGVGVAVALVGVLVAFMLWLRGRKASKAQDNALPNQAENTTNANHGTPGSTRVEADTGTEVREMMGISINPPVWELGGEQRNVWELDNAEQQRPLYEMEGDGDKLVPREVDAGIYRPS
ncbi:hypothetical protein CC80DRAFT_21349 [Byssothecium circinans]|uniref:Mid2 domain-containing protein n=1 Tax=Byssothecium circinans TaxID=147558 RepID=A0A6A5U2H4_9PLEO|nr:hypothetical protein CC80DRAFT_21349 [Byssothecium circinans]